MVGWMGLRWGGGLGVSGVRVVGWNRGGVQWSRLGWVAVEVGVGWYGVGLWVGCGGMCGCTGQMCKYKLLNTSVKLL